MEFRLEPKDLRFTETAPFRFENAADFAAPPAKVFEALTGPGFAKWFPDCLGVESLSATDPASGVGARRRVRLKTATVIENFVVWEPGKRWTFYLESMTLPLVTAMMEDYRLEARPGGGTRLQWDVHYQPRLVMRALHWPLRAVYGKMFRDGIAALGRHLGGGA